MSKKIIVISVFLLISFASYLGGQAADFNFLPEQSQVSGSASILNVDSDLFLRSDPSLKEPYWSFPGSQINEHSGYAVSSAGDVNGDGFDDVVIGVPHFDNTHTDGGRVVVFYGSETGLSLTPSWTADGGQTGALFGYSVSTAGDVNGDGFDDIIIGVPLFDNGMVSLGRAVVYYGSENGLSLSPDWTAEGYGLTAKFGSSVSTAGDVNNDGYDEVIIGAPYTSGGNVYVYLGSSSGLPSGYNWVSAGPNGSRLGYVVSSAGDVNNDGFDDVIMGAPYHDTAYTDAGFVRAFYGSNTGLPLMSSWEIYGTISANMLGQALTGGDINGDGYDDVVIGDPVQERVIAYHGSSTGLSMTINSTVPAILSDSDFGYSVSVIGDENGDGYDDLAVGAPIAQYDTLKNPGALYVFHGSSSGILTSPYWYAKGSISEERLGHSVSGAGDIQGVGQNSVIVGATNFDTETSDVGCSFLYSDNLSPIANAGINQSVDTLTSLVFLDGSGSSDPDGDIPLTYLWSQIGGLPVSLSSNTAASPSFTAPDDPSLLTFSLVVTDGVGAVSDADTVDVLINNQKPISSAGVDQSVFTLTMTSLDGSGSSDPDGDLPVSYHWSQIGGATVSLSDPNSATPSFVSPNNPGSVTFSLVVTDSLSLSSLEDQVVITVNNQTPIADAGPDQVVPPLSLVNLDGSGSVDPDGDVPLQYLWVQSGGPTVTLSSNTISSPSFSAPSSSCTLSFLLFVTDSLSLSDMTPDQVTIHVTNPPVANAGDNQSVNTNATVTLDGSSSYDIDGDIPLSFAWLQTEGPLVTLNKSTTSSPTFTASDDPALLTFSLTVTDSLGSVSSVDTVVVTVNNQMPVANAGVDQVVETISFVSLSASESYDPDNDIPLIFIWTQTGGISVTLSSNTVINPFFTAPASSTKLSFSLVVIDKLGGVSVPDQIEVTVEAFKVFLPMIIK